MQAVQRKKETFEIAAGSLEFLKQKMLNWANQFSIFLYLDSNEYRLPYARYECLIGAGSEEFLTLQKDIDPFSNLMALHKYRKDWLMGHLGYELKDFLEKKLSSSKEKKQQFGDIHFFVPEVVVGISANGKQFFIESHDQPPALIFMQIMMQDEKVNVPLPTIKFTPTLTKEDYLNKILALKKHIRNGDCYEINYCAERYCEDVEMDAIAAFQKLNRINPAPFAACYKLAKQWLLCASPERFLQKEKNLLHSQPIKGTARRSADPAVDEQLKKDLLKNEKERAENVMIVDLVRNDLARTCKPGTVKVTELFGIQSYPQVHQMVSTVAGELRDDVPFATAIANAFPMGSMTGAPKVKVMELTEEYETSRRELYSGSVGYISPDGDFDFNVVIRSLQYNEASGYLSYHTGGAITWDSVPEAEWEETQLKGWAMEQVFKRTLP